MGNEIEIGKLWVENSGRIDPGWKLSMEMELRWLLRIFHKFQHIRCTYSKIVLEIWFLLKIAWSSVEQEYKQVCIKQV